MYVDLLSSQLAVPTTYEVRGVRILFRVGARMKYELVRMNDRIASSYFILLSSYPPCTPLFFPSLLIVIFSQPSLLRKQRTPRNQPSSYGVPVPAGLLRIPARRGRCRRALTRARAICRRARTIRARAVARPGLCVGELGARHARRSLDGARRVDFGVGP